MMVDNKKVDNIEVLIVVVVLVVVVSCILTQRKKKHFAFLPDFWLAVWLGLSISSFLRRVHVQVQLSMILDNRPGPLQNFSH